ncbi:hypothetical protein OH76DRAFT_709322 [Lentinus brumalis]|uniref:Uncharacterized protein n=1 Tax=Lentinus brumalis TaxID=2498619 RepID=A0A371CH08_9APHY|nr:hypothetical protein OH76DRAFT_709322 [Polyporus brumalis]
MWFRAGFTISHREEYSTSLERQREWQPARQAYVPKLDHPSALRRPDFRASWRQSARSMIGCSPVFSVGAISPMHSFLYGLHYKPMRKEGAWVTGLLQDARPDRVSTGIHSQSRKASCLCEMVIRAKPELLSLRAWGKTHARKTEPNTCA